MILSGLSLLLYPTASDYLNNISRAKDISTYAESVAHTDKDKYQRMWDEAVDYNSRLAQMPTHWRLGEKEKAEYSQILNVSGTGIMSYVEIPKLNCSLPVYHQLAAGALTVCFRVTEACRRQSFLQVLTSLLKETPFRSERLMRPLATRLTKSALCFPKKRSFCRSYPARICVR